MSLPLKWEFPGGKIKAGESPEDCLRRELSEELGIEVNILQPLKTTTHRYPTFTVTLYPFLCTIRQGKITLREHVALSWLTVDQLHNLEWTAADIPILEEYRAIVQARMR